MKQRKFLVVTGATGFIGQQIVPLLKRSDLDLLLVGRDAEKVRQIFPDIECCGYSALIEKGAHADALLHLAVLNNDKPYAREAFQTANVLMLEEVTQMASKAKVARFIYPSSVHTLRKNDAYAQSKKQAEQFITGMDAITSIILCLPAVYGDDAYRGNLKILYKLPKFSRGFALSFLRRIRPVVHGSHVAEAILECMAIDHDTRIEL